MKIKQYKTKQKEIKDNLDELNKKSNILSWSRVILFLLATFAVFYGYFNKNSLIYIADLVVIVAFLILVKFHNQLEKQINYLESQNKVYRKFIRMLDGSWVKLKENGSEYLDEKLMHLKDLDVFGRGSLYQYICSANTVYGKRSLVKYLKNTDYDIEKIKSRQEAVRELSKLEDFSVELETLSYLIKENKKKNIDKEIEEFVTMCEDEEPSSTKLKKFLMFGLPAMFVGFFVVAAIGINPAYNLYLARTVLVLNLMISFLFMQKNVSILNPVSDFYKNISVYEDIFKKLEEADFKSEYLLDLKARLEKNGGAVEALDKLNKIGEYINTRQNFVGMLLFNAMFLWDLHCVDMVDKWKEKYGSQISDYLEVVGEMEALISLASIAYIRDDVVFPELFEKEAPAIEFKDLKHPLIALETVVGNDIGLDADTCIITGSNMSGKTTFMRSIGINLVLAYAGAPVVASEFKASLMKILTSVRVEDNVNKGISTFYAELLRIKEMTEYNKNKRPMICMIDEIFKGTNSADRIICATEAIKKLSKPHSIVLVSTHDFELCTLESEYKPVVNYHFSEYYENNEIKFDYKIKNGRCVTTNARVLLKMTGIVD